MSLEISERASTATPKPKTLGLFDRERAGYMFAVPAHEDPCRLDPLDGSQWEVIRKGKRRQFWYSPDFSGPSEIDKLSNPQVRDLHAHSSSGSHGGSIGIRSWRELPDHDHPLLRRDPSAQSIAVSGSIAQRQDR